LRLQKIAAIQVVIQAGWRLQRPFGDSQPLAMILKGTP
jgi:hypothetical protein